MYIINKLVCDVPMYSMFYFSKILSCLLPPFFLISLTTLRNLSNRQHYIAFSLLQDDFMDCFGNETVTGKKGTDIQEGKCSWLAVNALQRCNDAQRTLFAQNYASKDPDDVASIKRLYEDLQLPKLYKEQEDEIHSGILKKINALPSSTSPAIFFKLLDMIFKRSY